MLRPLLLLLALAAPLFAQESAPDSTVVDSVAPGLVHTYFVRQQGPWRVHVVRVDLRSGQYDVRSVRALDSLRGRETVSGMMARARRDAATSAWRSTPTSSTSPPARASTIR